MQIPGTWDTTDFGRTGGRSSGYIIDSNGNLTSYVVQATFEDIQSLLREHKYIFEGEHKVPTLQEVQEHYNFVKESKNRFAGVTIGSIIAGALGITFLMSTLNKRGRY